MSDRSKIELTDATRNPRAKGGETNTANTHHAAAMLSDKEAVTAAKEKAAQEAWQECCASGNKPDNIPEHPDVVYKDEWVSWCHWLGWDKDVTRG